MTSHKPDLFKRFPKKRTCLPEEYQEIFQQHYLDNRRGNYKSSFLTLKLEQWMHHQVASDLPKKESDISTLEIGAGTLNHLNFVSHPKNYDIVEPSEFFYKDSNLRKYIRNIYRDIRDIPKNALYDRIISIATFEHICDLPNVIAHCGLLLKPSGVLRFGIPNEGHWLWKTGYRLTTGREFKKKYNLDYDKIMEYEHVNTADEVEEVINFFFNEIHYKVFGINRSFCLYRFYNCLQPNVENCEKHTDIKFA